MSKCSFGCCNGAGRELAGCRVSCAATWGKTIPSWHRQRDLCTRTVPLLALWGVHCHFKASTSLMQPLPAVQSELNPADSPPRKRKAGSAFPGLSLSENFKPYSLRQMGQRKSFRATSNMHTAMEIGRWSTLRTAKIYSNGARADLTNTRHFESEAILRASQYIQPQLSAEVRL